MKLNPSVAIPSIMSSNDKAWLTTFRGRLSPKDAPAIVAALDDRLMQLSDTDLRRAIGRPLAELTLVERVQESVRVIEQFYLQKHAGKKISASRTRAMIKRWGEKEAVRRTVMTMTMSNGLELLARFDRLDCAYEQIILDFPEEFDEPAVTKAQANLAQLGTVAAA